jgi:hypothetical protein
MCSGFLILSIRCTRPDPNRGALKHSHLVRFFLPRRRTDFAADLRLLALFPGLFSRLLRFLARFDLREDAPGEVRRPPRNARNAVEDKGDLRPCKKAQTGAFRSGNVEAAYSGMRARVRAFPAGLAAA